VSSWRSHILNEFTPQIARLTLVADPDGLLLEEGILAGVRERGFELIPFEDPVAFRFAYESMFRVHWDCGVSTDLVVALRSQASDLSGLPYDLLQAGRQLAFNLGEIFPHLSYPVVAALDRGDLEALYQAQMRYAPGELGDNATKEFILRHVFEIAPELIKKPVDLLRVLLRRHYRGQRVPETLDRRLVQLLRQSGLFDAWPLETLLSDREAFFAFLQERWPIFLNEEARRGTPGVREEKEPYSLAVKGPALLPFEHDDIRIYIDNLFLEGMLRPISHDEASVLVGTWMGIGIQSTPQEDGARRLVRLLENIEQSIPAEEARHAEWLHFARKWAELSLLTSEAAETLAQDTWAQVVALRETLDARFTTWLTKRFAGLINLPPVPPVMLHHLPRYLAREVGSETSTKIALLVLDGLALDQWLLVRKAISARNSELHFYEESVFAWIPSITSVSRQALFAGKAPIYFPNSIQSTDKEPALWHQFWADQGFSAGEIVYVKSLGDGGLENLAEALTHPKVRIAGLVVDKVDKIIHGMELGTAGMHNQVAQWANQAYLHALLHLLLDNGFQVYLTSDHGNVEGVGCGRPADGALADLKGERVRIYPNDTLRDKVRERFPAAMAWDRIGLPEDFLPLLAPARQAFVQEGRRTVSHGGISIEELIVPLVHISRK